MCLLLSSRESTSCPVEDRPRVPRLLAVFGHRHNMIAMSENGQIPLEDRVRWRYGPGWPQLLQRADRPRFALRRRVLRRRHFDRRVLPADLPRTHAEASELPLLSHAPGSRAGRLPAMPAM